jgi:hypothetical protein
VTSAIHGHIQPLPGYTAKRNNTPETLLRRSGEGVRYNGDGRCAIAQVTIDLNEEQRRRIRELAAVQQKPEQQVYRDAIGAYLLSVPEPHDPADGASADYEPLQRMIGMVNDGPADMSVAHDGRPGDPA